jgi:hypothetical protein
MPIAARCGNLQAMKKIDLSFLLMVAFAIAIIGASGSDMRPHRALPSISTDFQNASSTGGVVDPYRTPSLTSSNEPTL